MIGQAGQAQPSPHPHINTQLIKNNYQTIAPTRHPTFSPPHQPITFQPIQMTNNPPHIRQNVIVSRPIHQQQLQPQQPGYLNFGTGSKGVSAPGPISVTKMEVVNRSNSSSRMISQQSRVEYINVNGDDGNAINRERNSVSPSYQQVRHLENQRKYYAPNVRPNSNLSNNSSNSRNSFESRPISNAPLTVIQSKSVDNRNMVISPSYTNTKPLSPSRLLPSQPPANITNPQPQIPRTLLHHPQTHNPQSHLPQPQPQSHQIPSISSLSPPQTNKTINLQVNGAPHLNMHTSDVKIVYQRGSFSPNSQHSSNSGEDSYGKKGGPFEQYYVNNGGHFGNYLSQYQIQTAKNVKISISDLQQKNDPSNNSKQQPKPPSNITNQATQSKPINPAPTTNPNTGKIQPTQVESIFIQQLKHNAESNQSLQSQMNRVPIRYQQSPSQPTPKTQPIPQPQPKLPSNPTQQPTQQQQPYKIYKSYDEYLAQTKKPQKIIQQIQESQLGTQINIHYQRTNQGKFSQNSDGQRSISIPEVYGSVRETEGERQRGRGRGRERGNQDGDGERYGEEYGEGHADGFGSSDWEMHDHGDFYDGQEGDDYRQVKDSLEFYGQVKNLPEQNNKNNSENKQQQITANKITNNTNPPFPQTTPTTTPTTPLTQNPPPKQPLTINNISTIKQQSQQYNDPDHSHSHSHSVQESSSMIGSSLQDNLQQIHPSKEFSDFQGESWSKLKYQQIDKFQNVPTSNMYRHRNVNDINLGNGDAASNWVPAYYGTTINTDVFGGPKANANNKINPFAMIGQDDQPPTINNPTNIKPNTNPNPISNSNSKPNKNPTLNPTIPTPTTPTTPTNPIIPTPPTNTTSNLSINIKQNHQNPTTPSTANQATMPVKQNGYREENDWIIGRNRVYQNQDSKYRNVSTKDKIASEKIIHINHHHYYQHQHQQHGRYTHQHIHSTHSPRPLQPQNQQQQYSEEPTVDVYQLIDSIFNKQLQNGLSKIRQVFGHAMVGYGYTGYYE